MAEKNLNRIKVMLAEKGKTNKWLAEKLGRDQATISKWCTNACQPPLEALIRRSGRCPWQANQRYDSHETKRMCNPTHRVAARGISSTLN